MLSERIAQWSSDAAARVKRMLEHVEGHARMRMVFFVFSLLLIGSVMFLLNVHTPLMMDDYDYSFNWSTGERIAAGDVIASQAAHYAIWGGRSVVHAIAQLFLSMNKAVFSMANTLMYLLLLLEIYALARPKGRSWCYTLLLGAHAALFALVPFFGTVFLWLTGSCNYLWGTALALTPLLIARNAQDGGFFSRRWHGWLALPASFLAGWTNENTACGMLALMGVLLFARMLGRKKVYAWQWAALALQAAGTAVMLLAPGNFTRASSYETGNIVVELIRRAATATVYGGVYVGVLLAVCIILWELCGALQVKGRRAYVLLLLFGAFGAAYSMVASPVFSDRSWTGVVVLVLCAALALLGDLEEKTRAFDAARLLVLPFVLLLIAYGGYKALGDVRAHEAAWLSQVQKIEAAAAAGDESVAVCGVESTSPYTMPIAIAEDAEAWPNATLSKVFGILVNGK